MLGSPGTPATEAMRPAGAGPMYRNLNCSGVEACCGPAGPPLPWADPRPGRASRTHAATESVRQQDLMVMARNYSAQARWWKRVHGRRKMTPAKSRFAVSNEPEGPVRLAAIVLSLFTVL